MDTAQLPAPPHGHPPRPHRPEDKRPGAQRTGHGEPSHPGDAADLDHDRIDLNVPKPRKGWILLAVLGIVVALGALLVVGILPRLSQQKELSADAEAALNAPVPVNVIVPRRAPKTMDVPLPGSLRPWQEVSIFARTTGYLKKYYVDISNQVKQGDLMAEIDTPEIDQQLRGAQATLLQLKAAQAKAQNDLALSESTYKRYYALRQSNGVTQLELDQKESEYNSAKTLVQQATANVAVGEAEVKRLSDLQGFEKVTAPFSGVITSRPFDVGSMIIANPTSLDIKPMYKIAENDILRVFVNVPQAYALSIQKGMEVKVTARERPGRVYTGKVMGTTNYLDPTNRSLLTEIKVPNPDFSLLPGMYVQATFHITRDHPPLMIPSPALVTDADGNRVGVVEDGKIHYKNVQVGVDYGKEIEVVEGLTGDEQIIGNPGERTEEGVSVKVANAPEAKVAAAQEKKGD